MAGPLRGWRVLLVGEGTVLDEAAALVEALDAVALRVPADADPAALAGLEPLGALVAGVVAPGAADPFAAVPFPFVRVADPAPDPTTRWARCGAMALTGAPDGPWWGPPGRLVDSLCGAGALVQLLAACRGMVLDLDPLALLAERAAITGFGRGGPAGVGGTLAVVAAADGWVALNLARPDDRELLAAWTEGEADAADWSAVARWAARRPAAALEAQAVLLGLPVAVDPWTTGGDPSRAPSASGAWVGDPPPAPWLVDGRVPASARRLRATEPEPGRPAPDAPLVVDLSSLWAGPLATRVLTACGARVVKVESVRRPDGARRGPAAFFAAMHAGKESVALDLDDAADRALLGALVERAAVVVEASRPRAAAGLGLDPEAVVRTGRTTWVSITGHGRRGEAAHRVAFGDDAAFAAGLTVAADPGDAPTVVADAVADPIAGLYAALAALAALVGARGNLVEVSLAGAAAYAARGPRAGVLAPAVLASAASGAGLAAVLPTAPAVPPPVRGRPAGGAPGAGEGAAPALGAHTDAWRRRLAVP